MEKAESPTNFSASFSPTSSISLLSSADFSSDTEIYSDIKDLNEEIHKFQMLKQKVGALQRERSQILRKYQPSDTFNELRLEAEKLLIINKIRIDRLLAGFKKQKSLKEDFHIGSVNISELKLHNSIKGHNKYFLCFLMTDTDLIVSKIAQTDSQGSVDFEINHTLSNLSSDFEITIRIYVLDVKKSSHKKNSKLLCCQHHETEEQYYVRDSLFEFWDEIIIKISDINQSHEFFLDLSHSQLCKLTVDVTGEIDDTNLRYTGWLDISKNKGIFWNKRWCTLYGTKLKYFNHPVESFYIKPINVIDLRWCISVRTPNKKECMRSNTLILTIKQDEKLIYYYLSFDTKTDFEKCKTYFTNLVSTVLKWRRNGCIPF